MKTILLLLLTLITSTSFAQKDIIVLTNLDTIHCKVSKIKGETIDYKLNEDEFTIESKSVYYVLTDIMKRPRYFNQIDETGKEKIVQKNELKNQSDEDIIMTASLERITCSLKMPTKTHIVYTRAGLLDSLYVTEVFAVVGRNMKSPKYYNTEGHGKIKTDMLRKQVFSPSNHGRFDRNPIQSWEAIAGSRLQASGGFMLGSIALGLATVLSAAKPYSNELTTGLGLSSGVCVILSSGFLISAGQALKKK